jgi:hypothetical protein
MPVLRAPGSVLESGPGSLLASAEAQVAEALKAGTNLSAAHRSRAIILAAHLAPDGDLPALADARQQSSTSSSVRSRYMPSWNVLAEHFLIEE